MAACAAVQAPFGVSPRAAARRPVRQASEQKRTSSQVRAHFLRHVKGRPQAAHVFVGSVGFLWAITGPA